MRNRISLVPRFLIILVCCAPCLNAQNNLPDTLRFGVFSLFKSTHLVIRPAKDHVLLLTISEAGIPVDSELEIRSIGDGLRITGDGHSYGAESLLITSRNGGATDFAVAIPGKISRNFRGTLQVTQSHRRLRALVSIDRELAVASAVKAEAPPGEPMEALKAQAVV